MSSRSLIAFAIVILLAVGGWQFSQYNKREERRDFVADSLRKTQDADLKKAWCLTNPKQCRTAAGPNPKPEPQLQSTTASNDPPPGEPPAPASDDTLWVQQQNESDWVVHVPGNWKWVDTRLPVINKQHVLVTYMEGGTGDFQVLLADSILFGVRDILSERFPQFMRRPDLLSTIQLRSGRSTNLRVRYIDNWVQDWASQYPQLMAEREKARIEAQKLFDSLRVR